MVDVHRLLHDRTAGALYAVGFCSVDIGEHRAYHPVSSSIAKDTGAAWQVRDSIPDFHADKSDCRYGSGIILVVVYPDRIDYPFVAGWNGEIIANPERGMYCIGAAQSSGWLYNACISAVIALTCVCNQFVL